MSVPCLYLSGGDRRVPWEQPSLGFHWRGISRSNQEEDSVLCYLVQVMNWPGHCWQDWQIETPQELVEEWTDVYSE